MLGFYKRMWLLFWADDDERVDRGDEETHHSHSGRNFSRGVSICVEGCDALRWVQNLCTRWTIADPHLMIEIFPGNVCVV